MTEADQVFMRRALELAARAAERGEVPVGAVAVVGTHVIAGAHNLRETERDPTAHAELIAMRDAARRLGRWRLSDVTIYVTLEPCAMCAGALVNARVGRLVFGATDPKAGAVSSLYEIGRDPRLNHRLPIDGGVLAEEAGTLLRDFFQRRR